MAEYLETLGVALLAMFGVFTGKFFVRLGKPYWGIGYVAPFLLLGMIASARWFDGLAFVQPFTWLMAGRREFVALAPACAMLLTTALARLPLRRQRALVNVFMVIAVGYFSVLPFALPALLRGRLTALETVVDPNGVCIQGTIYTCGPAAAVTALDRLGIEAGEGEIAVVAHTNPLTGTPGDALCDALEKLYGDAGLTCDSRHFDSIAALKEAGPTIAVIKYSFMVDHYVAVLDISDDEIVLGDPLRGKRTLTHAEFMDIWRRDAVVLKMGG